MDKKDERNSVVPLGTFSTSVAPLDPSPRAAAQPANTQHGDNNSVQTREVRASSPGPDATEGESERERKRTRTLLGVPTPPSDPIAQADKINYPSPPKWKSSRDDTPTAQQATQAVPVAKIELRPNPQISQRSALGSAPAGKGGEVASENISEAIQQMLDEQTSVSMEEVEDDAAPLDLLLESELQQLPDSVPPPAQVAADQIVAAVAADQVVTSAMPTDQIVASKEESASAEAVAPRKSMPVIVPAHIAQRQQNRTDEETVRMRMRPEAASKPEESGLLLTDISSLAPAEVQRLPAKRDDAAPALGFMMVAAMALLAVGGWLFTAGGYQRPSSARAIAQAAQPTAAKPTVATLPQPTAVAALPTLAPAAGTALVAETPAPAAKIAAPASPARSAPIAAAATRLAKTPAPAVHLKRATPIASPEPAAEPDSVLTITRVGNVAPAHSDVDSEPLPEQPSRDDVVTRLEGMRSAVQVCAEGRTGVAELDITIAGTGVITNVLVGGDFAGSAQGSCIARTVRQLHFPRFQRERMRLLFPYSI